MEYPNKTFVLEYTQTNHFGTTTSYIIIVAANKETASNYLNDKLGCKTIPNDLTWLMNTNHPTIYNQKGDKPLDVQAKILYNAKVRS